MLLQQGVLPLEVVDVLLVSVVFPPHVLDVLGGLVQDLRSGRLFHRVLAAANYTTKFSSRVTRDIFTHKYTTILIQP